MFAILANNIFLFLTAFLFFYWFSKIIMVSVLNEVLPVFTDAKQT